MIYIPKKRYTDIEYNEEFARSINQVIIINDDISTNVADLFSVWNQKCQVLISSCLSDFYEFLNSKKFNINHNYLIIGAKNTPHETILDYKSLMEFMIYYKKEYKYLHKYIVQLGRKEKKSKDNKLIKEELNYFYNLNESGKLLRAVLISMGYKMFNTLEDNKYLDLALAYEIFETAILVHDDIIDGATTRRGKDTIEEAFNKSLTLEDESLNYKKERMLLSRNLALCMGDYGFFKAFKMVSNAYDKDIVNYFSKIMLDTVKGEILDTKYPFMAKHLDKKTTLNDVLEIYKNKTSMYSVVGPFNLGLMANKAPKAFITRMTKAMEGMGIAFQIKDDILGIFSDSMKTGKTASDIMEFKQTLLYYYVSRTEYKDEFMSLYGNKLKQSDFERLKEILIESKAYDKTIKEASKYLDESKEMINKIRLIPKYYKEVLNGLILYMDMRDR